MQAAWYVRNGPAAEVLQVGEQPRAEPGLGEVLVRVVCSGVNPSDVKSRARMRSVAKGIVIAPSDAAQRDAQCDPEDTAVCSVEHCRPYQAAGEE